MRKWSLLVILAVALLALAGCGDVARETTTSAPTTTLAPSSTTTAQAVTTTTKDANAVRLTEFLRLTGDAVRTLRMFPNVDFGALSGMVVMLDRYDLPVYDPEFTQAKMRLLAGLQAAADYDELQHDPKLAPNEAMSAAFDALTQVDDALEGALPYLDALYDK